MRIKLNLLFILFLFAAFYLGFFKESLILFASVILHELGHVFTAKKIGVFVEAIELYPFGGVARMEDLSKYGGLTETVIASAGPLTSGTLALLAFAGLKLGGDMDFFDTCFRYNCILFVFNLVPALPMDGGRIIRNILTLYMSFKKATGIMVFTGRLAAVLLLSYNILLLVNRNNTLAYVLTAVFIYAGTVKEMRYCSYYYLLNKSNKKARDIRNRRIRKREINVYKDTYIRFAASQFSSGSYCIINVMDDSGKIIKVLNEADIMNAFLKYGYDAKIGEILK